MCVCIGVFLNTHPCASWCIQAFVCPSHCPCSLQQTEHTDKDHCALTDPPVTDRFASMRLHLLCQPAVLARSQNDSQVITGQLEDHIKSISKNKTMREWHEGWLESLRRIWSWVVNLLATTPAPQRAGQKIQISEAHAHHRCGIVQVQPYNYDIHFLTNWKCLWGFG